jgi:chemotaxis protein methyltransferase CheR
MTDGECVDLLREYLPRFGLSWRGFRRFRRQVCKRVARRLRALGLPDVLAYRERLAADPDEQALFDGMCRVTLSRFYRDRAVFDRLRAEELPRLAQAAARERRQLRCWTAGCASGEEPYTLALALRLGLAPAPPLPFETRTKNHREFGGSHGDPEGARALARDYSGFFPPLFAEGKGGFAILATDADAAVLERARAARYSKATLRELPQGWVERAFAAQGASLLLRPEYRGGIRWARMDLRRELPDGPFDLVMCRNLAFTYFAPALQSATLDRIAQRLAPGAVLVVGAHESLPDEGGWTRAGRLPIYRREA